MTVTTYLRPRSLTEAIALLGSHGPELLVVAGGTVAMPLINEGISLPDRVMSLKRAGLDAIEVREDSMRIGATATLSRVLAAGPPAPLADAIAATGSHSVRNLATIGGNLFTPPPGGDVTVALLALDAAVVVAGPEGERRVPVASFLTGFLATNLAQDEIVVALEVPTAPRETAFIKFGRKAANTPAVVTVAVSVARRDGRVVDARVALGAVGPHAMRSAGAEAAILGTTLEPEAIERAAGAAADDADPITDAIATAWYRRRMTRLFVARALRRVAAPEAKEA